ncbi:MAG: sugar lactone lactonase YvrE [Glaciecola sp.]|jgi:sugar lactone lactonase YvrE
MARTHLRPVRWIPPQDPGFTGVWARNERLAGVRVIPVPGEGPEDLTFAPDGTAYTGVEDGRILSLAPGATSWITVGNTGGRPGGLQLDATGAIIAADYRLGLVRMDAATGESQVLTDRVKGERLRCCNNVDIHADGRIFFSSSSQRWDLHELRLDAFEHTATGRLLVFDPADGSTEVVLADLPLANGVAVAQDGSYVAVANTAGYDIDRVWLSGPAAGTRDKLVESLPGMPDNLSVGADGRIWMAMVLPRNALLELLLPRHPLLRTVAARVPDRIIPEGPRCMLAFALDPSTGEVLESLQSWHKPPLHYITGVNEAPDGTIWLSSINEQAVGVHTPG